ncbi:monocarboxylate transporter 13-like isoform X2 [Hemitrygon akajei]|uniref:monocarboxylate transporter 13-like isoform X2 n=1 Tax=Hemitrygon akajei TaxID=2704970 RepID=UPI003BFA1596
MQINWAIAIQSKGSMEVSTSEELGAANCPTKKQNKKAGTPKYADGGYGWVVLASCFTITGLTSSFVRAFGIFFLDIQNCFDTLAFKVSWISAITVTVFHLSSPLASILNLKLSHRVIAMIGGIFSMLGLFLGSFAFSLSWMYITVGFLLGLGNGLAWISSVSMVNQYFTDRRPLANALSSAGDSVFVFIFTPFYQWLINTMSWQQAMMIIAGIHLNICVCGALLRPIQKRCQKSAPSFATNLRNDSRCSSAYFKDLTRLKEPKLIYLILFGLFSVMGLFIPMIYLVPHAQSIGIEDFKAAFLMSYWSASDLIGRVGCGWFANMRLLTSVRLTIIVTTILSVLTLLFPLAKNYASLIVFSCGCGFFVGTTMALLITLVTDVVGAKNLSNALGILMFFRSIGCLAGPPLAGLVVDWTKDYSTAFLLAGGGMLIASCFLIPVDYLLTCGQHSVQGSEKEMESCKSQDQSQEEAEKVKVDNDRMEDLEPMSE